MPRARTALTTLVLAGAAVPFMAVSPASAAPVAVPAAQWDFNGDGHADLAVGAPGEDIGSPAIQQAGSVSVFLANPSTGAYTTSQDFTQDTAGVPGSAETGDQFGYALTSGDFDGDGYADLAVSANREDIGSGSSKKTDAGLITVLWGSASGITGTGAVNLEFNPGGSSSSYAFAGDALAAGDMNNDGKDELAVGGPGIEYARVYVGAGRASFGTTWKTIRENSTAGTVHSGDLFGESLAMGDFNDDGRADLVVGVPYDTDDYKYSVGAIVVVPGQSDPAQPLNLAAAKRWSPKTGSVQGAGHTFTVNDLPDSFGRTLGVGDYNNDGRDDLAVSAPGTPVARSKGGKAYEDAGRVHVLFGSASGITDAGNLLITQESEGVAGGSETGDLFGASLDGGRVSGKDLLAIGSAEESVRVLPGASGVGSVNLTQDSTGVAGGTENGDSFGAFVRFLANDGANESLAVGVPGEDTSAGALYVLPTVGGMSTGVGSSRYDQDTAGVAGGKESGDAWGWLGDSH